MTVPGKGGRPKAFESVAELEEKIEAYKTYLKDNDKPPTIAGLAYYTGIDRQTLYNYKAKDEFFGTIKGFVDWIIMTYEEEAITKGKAGIIFLMKNYGYTDKTELNVSGNIDITYSGEDELED
jgi:hypothetical protein